MTQRLAVFLLAALLCGCGRQPASAPMDESQAANPAPLAAAPNPNVVASIAPAIPPTGDPVADTRKALASARALLSGYSLTMKWYQKSGGGNSNGTYAVQGMGKSTLIEITQGTPQGARILWQGGSSLQVKLAGLLGAVPVTLDTTNPQVVSARGYTIQQTNLTALLDLAEDPAHKAVPLPSSGPAMTLTGGKLLPNTQRIDIYASVTPGLPTRIDFWDATQIVYHMDISAMKRKAISSLSF